MKSPAVSVFIAKKACGEAKLPHTLSVEIELKLEDETSGYLNSSRPAASEILARPCGRRNEVSTCDAAFVQRRAESAEVGGIEHVEDLENTLKLVTLREFEFLRHAHIVVLEDIAELEIGRQEQRLNRRAVRVGLSGKGCIELIDQKGEFLSARASIERVDLQSRQYVAARAVAVNVNVARNASIEWSLG